MHLGDALCQTTKYMIKHERKVVAFGAADHMGTNYRACRLRVVQTKYRGVVSGFCIITGAQHMTEVRETTGYVGDKADRKVPVPALVPRVIATVHAGKDTAP